MNALWTSPLGPTALLLGGGGLLLTLHRRLSPQLRQRLPTALVLLGMAAWLLLRLQPQSAGQWWLWQAPLGLETALGVQWDDWSWLTGWLIFLAALAALILPRRISRPGAIPPRFWIPILLAASLLAISSATWSALLAAWAIMLFFTGVLAGSPSANAPKAWTFLLLAGLFLLTTPLFNGNNSLLITLGANALNLQAQLLLILAATILIGIYPFHSWLTSTDRRPEGAQLALQLIPALAAIHLLSRFQLPLLGSFSWIALGIAGLLGSALAAWTAPEEQRAWTYVVINRATWVILAISLSRDAGLGRWLFPMTMLAVSVIIWALITTLGKGRWLRWLALLFLIGFPLTPGFVLNITIAQLANTVLGFPGWILTLLAQTLLVATLLRPIASQISIDAPYLSSAGRLRWMLTLILIFGLWWGAFPAALARTAGVVSAGGYASALAQMRTAGALSGWATLLAPLLLGWLLSRRQLFSGVEAWQKRISDIATLNWFYDLLEATLHYLTLSLGFAADILDGAGQFGWVLLALLILWLFTR